jgi:hypothetical protein
MVRSSEDYFGAFIGLDQHVLDRVTHPLQQQQYL